MLEKLAKQTAIYGISTILGRMLSYLLTPFYTRIFGVESYGIITDVYALIPFALVVLTMGMESSYFRFAAKAEAEGGNVEQNKRKLFATTWGITSLAALLFFVVVLLCRNGASALMGEVYAANPLYVVTVAAIVMMDVVACIPFARLREQGKALTFVALKLFNIILQVGLAVAFWAFGFRLNWWPTPHRIRTRPHQPRHRRRRRAIRARPADRRRRCKRSRLDHRRKTRR